MKRSVLAVALLLLISPDIVQTQHVSDEQSVRRAALDYIEGFYEGDGSKMHRSIRPEVAKYGFWRDGASAYEGSRWSSTTCSPTRNA